MTVNSRPNNIQFFPTCLVNDFFPEVGLSTVRVLERLGIVVEVPDGLTCCGQPAFNAGYPDDARKAARHIIEVLSETEGPVVIPSGSCTHMIIHNYPFLFRQDDKFLQKVSAAAGRCVELTAFLVDVLGESDFGLRLDMKAVYHPSCHLTRGLKIRRQPETLLQNIKGLELLPFDDQDECCGFGGVFSVKNPEISGYLLDKKIKNIEASGAEAVIGCDMGCLMHIEGGLHRRDSSIRALHIAQVLDEGLH